MNNKKHAQGVFFIGADDGNLPKPLKGNPLASCANSLRLFNLISSAQPSPAGPYPYRNQKKHAQGVFFIGADDGNRTRNHGLGSRCFTTELHPHI